MMFSKPQGPRNRPALSIAPNPPPDPQPPSNRYNSQRQPQPYLSSSSTANSRTKNTTLSPTSAPRFNTPVPVLNTPIPRKKSGALHPQIRVNIGVPPLPLKVGEDGEQATIRPQATYSPEERPHRAAFPSIGAITDGIQPVLPPVATTQDSMIGLREAVHQIAIGSHPSSSGSLNTASSYSPDNTNGAITPSPSGSTSYKLSPSSKSGLSSGQKLVLPTPPAGKEFTDSVLEVLSRLGEGAGGAVHKVRDTRDGAIYARKTITTREVSTRQVVRELNIISTTSHVNIVQCFGAYMSPSSSEVKIVMEYGEGGSLEAIGQKLKEVNAIIGEKIAGRIAEGVLQGLAYLHTRRTIHRDIKPSNILLSRHGIVKLCDFGVSGELVNSLVGTFTGTLIYMAPERVLGGEYTVRSDVWSTGVSLLELVQNRFPFPADLSTIELIVTITKGEPPSLEDQPEAGITWSPDMKDFIRQTLIQDPHTRPTPREMLAHPWIVNVMRQEVHMGRWIRQVWGWAKPEKRSRKGTHSTTGKVEGKADSDSESGSLSRPSTASSTTGNYYHHQDSNNPAEAGLTAKMASP